MTFKTLARCSTVALLIGICLAAPGCRRRDPYTDGVLEITRAEKMDLEDQIYALEDKLAEKERELEAIRARKPSAIAPRGTRTSPAAPRTEVMPDEDLVPPAIDPGIPVEPKIELPPIEATPAAPAKPAARPPFRPAARVLTPPPARKLEEAITPPGIDEEPTQTEELPLPSTNDVSQASFSVLIKKDKTDDRHSQENADETDVVEDNRVTTLFINPFQTMGVELDQQPGDDGIMLLCEPRNEAGQFVPQSGEMTVVVLDPALEGEAARIARWDLSKNEVGQRLLDARPERGIKAQLKWPEKRPEHGKLKLFVRYRTTDGRQVEAHSDVFITMPGELSQRWTPRQQ